jgi:hypothetical protein
MEFSAGAAGAVRRGVTDGLVTLLLGRACPIVLLLHLVVQVGEGSWLRFRRHIRCGPNTVTH